MLHRRSQGQVSQPAGAEVQPVLIEQGPMLSVSPGQIAPTGGHAFAPQVTSQAQAVPQATEPHAPCPWQSIVHWPFLHATSAQVPSELHATSHGPPAHVRLAHAFMAPQVTVH